MEHRRHIGKADQRRLARRRLLEVRHVENHRPRAQQLRLRHKAVHPRAARFVVTLEVVAIPQCQRLAVRLEHLEHAHVRVVHRDVLALLEGDPVQLVRRIEDAVLQHVPYLEVRLHLVFVQIVLRLAHLLGVHVPVPWLQLEPALLRGARGLRGACGLSIDRRLDVLAFRNRLRRRRRHQRIHELFRCLRCLRHLVFQVPRCKVRVPQQHPFLRAQLRQSRYGRPRIVRPPALRPGPRVRKHRLPRRTVRQRHQDRLLRRVLQRQYIALHFAVLRRLHRGRQLRVAQPLQRSLVFGGVRRRLGRLQQLRAEVVHQRRLFFVQLVQLRLVCRRQVCPFMHEPLVVHVQQPPRLRIQPQRIHLLVERGHPLEQLLVQEHCILQRGNLRRLDLLHLLQHWRRVRLRHRVQHRLHAIEQLPALLQRHQRVVEGRRRRVFRDRLDFLQLLRNPGLQRRLVVAVLDLVERRRLVRQRARRIKRILRPNHRRPCCRLPCRGRPAPTQHRRTRHHHHRHPQKSPAAHLASHLCSKIHSILDRFIVAVCPCHPRRRRAAAAPLCGPPSRTSLLSHRSEA